MKGRGIFGKIMEFRELFLYPCLSSMEGHEEKWEGQGKLENQGKQMRGISSLIPTPHSSRFQLGMSLNPSWICDMGSVRSMGSMNSIGSMGSVSSYSAKFQWQNEDGSKFARSRIFLENHFSFFLLPTEIIGISGWGQILVREEGNISRGSHGHEAGGLLEGKSWWQVWNGLDIGKRSPGKILTKIQIQAKSQKSLDLVIPRKPLAHSPNILG